MDCAGRFLHKNRRRQNVTVQSSPVIVTAILWGLQMIVSFGQADDSIGGQLFFALADAEFIRAVGIVTPDLSMFDDQMVHAASWDVYSKFLILFKGKCCNLLSVYGNMGGLSLGSRKKVLVSQKNRGRKEKDRC